MVDIPQSGLLAQIITDKQLILRIYKQLLHLNSRKINEQLKITDCEPYGNSPSGEAAQTPGHGISKRGLGREARRGLCPLE